jgi:hypothetical protein
MAGTEESEPDPSRFPQETFLVIPGERLPEVIAREVGVIGVASTVLVATLMVLANRRRPS